MKLAQQRPRSVLNLFHASGLCPRNCTGQTLAAVDPGREDSMMLWGCPVGETCGSEVFYDDDGLSSLVV